MRPKITLPGISLLTAFSLAVTPRLAAADAPEPPRDIPLKEVDFEQLSNAETGANGQIALEINPKKWHHAETDNFILHFRRVTEAKKVAREVEYNLWFVARALSATKDQYSRKSHVFIFEDEEEWNSFLSKLPDVPQWSVSFAHGDELFLNIRRTEGPHRFESGTLAHECTHAVVARLYPETRWPLWLNEGFAEYMGGASVATRRNQTVKRHQEKLDRANLPIEQLVALKEYPSSEMVIAQLYQSSEKLVRFLFNELPKDRFRQFVEVTLAGKDFNAALMEVYGDKLQSYKSFEKDYADFSK